MTCDATICHFTFPAEQWTSCSHPCPPWAPMPEASETSYPPCPPRSPRLPFAVSEPEYQACDGSVIRNTFIEVASSPSTPHNSHCRSQSVPRNLGYRREAQDEMIIKDVALS